MRPTLKDLKGEMSFVDHFNDSIINDERMNIVEPIKYKDQMQKKNVSIKSLNNQLQFYATEKIGLNERFETFSNINNEIKENEHDNSYSNNFIYNNESINNSIIDNISENIKIINHNDVDIDSNDKKDRKANKNNFDRNENKDNKKDNDLGRFKTNNYNYIITKENNIEIINVKNNKKIDNNNNNNDKIDTYTVVNKVDNVVNLIDNIVDKIDPVVDKIENIDNIIDDIKIHYQTETTSTKKSNILLT